MDQDQTSTKSPGPDNINGQIPDGSTRVTSTAVVSGAFLAWRSNARRLVHVSLFWLVLPQFALYLISSQLALSAGRGLWGLTDRLDGKNTPSADQFLEVFKAFFGPFSLLWLAALLLFCFAFSCFVHINTVHFTQKPSPDHIASANSETSSTYMDLYRQALPYTFKIFLISMLLQFFVLIGMQFLVFHIVAIVLGSVAPVILVMEHKGALKSLWNALLLKYADKTKNGPVTLFFSLGGSGAIVYLLCEFLFYLLGFMPSFDLYLGVGREHALSFTVGGIQFLKLLNVLLGMTVTALAISFVASITAQFYFMTRKSVKKYY